MTKRILITGGAGFVAHHLIDRLVNACSMCKSTDLNHLCQGTPSPNWDVIILDKLTYASDGFNRLKEIGVYGNDLPEHARAQDKPKVKLYTVDLRFPMGVGLEKELGRIDYIVHMAAETHVDNSISGPRIFVESNVLGTFEMLELARRLPELKKFVYFSTDEVFGPAPGTVLHKEWDRYNSTNPYAATKAAGEELALAWANTYKVPVIVTHTMNVCGERQHPEKFIPKVIAAVMQGNTMTIHADPTKTKSGTRFYIHARNVAEAVLFLLERGEIREKYNIIGEQEVSNLELAQFIAGVVGKPLHYEMVDFHSSRPGHDLRYGLDGRLLRKMGWRIPMNFFESLTNTIKWTMRPENRHWLNTSTQKSLWE